jgi:hypothetical protein
MAQLSRSQFRDSGPAKSFFDKFCFIVFLETAENPFPTVSQKTPLQVPINSGQLALAGNGRSAIKGP